MTGKIGKRMTLNAVALVAAAAALAACGGSDNDTVAQTAPPPATDTTTTPPASTATPTLLPCEKLLGMVVPAASIGLPTLGGSVTSANLVAASGTGATAVPSYCEITGKITPVDVTAPNILFQVSLPVEWNQKTVMFGGGGFNGTIPSLKSNVPAGPTDKPTPLGRGYATFASDSGHQSNALATRDGLFGANDEALRNYGGDALKKTRDAATAIIKAYYGTLPVKSYFAGGSNGGREALTIIQRWPQDWDGAIAWYPAWNDTAALLSGQFMSRALAQPGAYLNPAKRLALYDAAMEACDSLDGVKDGLIANQNVCNATFDPATATLRGAPLRCAAGADTGDTCLSDAQIVAMKKLNGAFNFQVPMLNGDTTHPGFNMWGADTGITAWNKPTQAYVSFVNFGTAQPATPMPVTAPFMAQLADQFMKYFVTRDPAFVSLSFDPENMGAWGTRMQEVARLLDAKTDISAFQARGGKLLIAHGLTDTVVSSRPTRQYYERLQNQFGAATVNSFVRFYEVAGYAHASSNVFNVAWDSLTALDEWRVDGKAPAGQVATDITGVPGRTRPLCDYPAWPKYKGNGDVNIAASFECVVQ